VAPVLHPQPDEGLALIVALARDEPRGPVVEVEQADAAARRAARAAAGVGGGRRLLVAQEGPPCIRRLGRRAHACSQGLAPAPLR
jgi:hypothetical protein